MGFLHKLIPIDNEVQSLIKKVFSRIIFVLGGKGGTGKSNFTVNLCYLLSLVLKSMDGKVLGIDTDLQTTIANYYATDEQARLRANKIIASYRSNIGRLLNNIPLLQKTILHTYTRKSEREIKNSEDKYDPCSVDLIQGFAKRLMTMSTESHAAFMKGIRKLPGYQLKVIDAPAGYEPEIIAFAKTAIELGAEPYVVTELTPDALNGLIEQLYLIAVSMGLKKFRKIKFKFVINKYHKKNTPEFKRHLAKDFLEKLSDKFFDKEVEDGKLGEDFLIDLSHCSVQYVSYDKNFYNWVESSRVYWKDNKKSNTGMDLKDIAQSIAEEMLGWVHISRIKEETWKMAFEAPKQDHPIFLKWRSDVTPRMIKSIGGKELMDLWEKTHPTFK